MSRQIQIRRGDNTKHQKFTGAIGEVTMNTTKNTLCVHDGKTVGGNEMLSRNSFYSYITNCFTEIPQDIKLELNNGTLVLKSGSRIYVPNGSNTFTTIDITNDLTYTYSSTGKFILLLRSTASTFIISSLEATVSGTEDILADQTYHTWYDTKNNIIKRYGSDGNNPQYTASLPIAIISVSNGAISNIDKIFNGFGYIGTTVFSLPGIRGLIPNGRNYDGTLKNKQINTSKISIYTLPNGAAEEMHIGIQQNGSMYRLSQYSYDATNNYILNGGAINNVATFCKVSYNTSTITSFEHKSVFAIIN